MEQEQKVCEQLPKLITNEIIADKIQNIKTSVFKKTVLTSDLLNRANSLDIIRFSIDAYCVDKKFIANKPFSKFLVKLFLNFGKEDFFYTRWTDGYKVNAIQYYEHLLGKSTDLEANEFYNEQLQHYQKYNPNSIMFIAGKNRAFNITDNILTIIKNDLKNIILKDFNDIDEYFAAEKLTFDELKNMETAKNGWYGGNSEQKTKYLFKALQDYNVEILRDYFNINDNKILIDDIRKYCDDRIRFIEDLRVLIDILF
jgi:hypothetical protein